MFARRNSRSRARLDLGPVGVRDRRPLTRTSLPISIGEGAHAHAHAIRMTRQACARVCARYVTTPAPRGRVAESPFLAKTDDHVPFDGGRLPPAWANVSSWIAFVRSRIWF